MPENNRSSGVWDSKECALLLIDYQPGVMSFIRSHDRKLVELNARYLTKAALAFDIPIILSTVGVQMGVNQPTIASLRNEVPNVPEIDRTSMDSWADRAFVEAVKKTARKRLVMSGIVTEVCLAYPVVAALKDGYEVSIITDAAGGLTRESHDVAVLRMIQAGAVPRPHPRSALTRTNSPESDRESSAARSVSQAGGAGVESIWLHDAFWGAVAARIRPQPAPRIEPTGIQGNGRIPESRQRQLFC
jgi:nicotinamidase-related amidase